MSISDHSHSDGSRAERLGTSKLIILLLLCLPITGCSGCRQDPNATAQGDTPPEPEIIGSMVRVMPAHSEALSSFVKPGHWASGYQEYKASRQDFRGSLNTIAGKQSGPVTIPGSDYGFRFTRPAVLAKGQKKRFDLRFLVPAHVAGNAGRLALNSSFDSRQGLSFQAGNTLLRPLQSQQYMFVMLTTRPTEVQFITDDDWRKMLADGEMGEKQILHYQVVVPEMEDVIAFPDSFMDMTSIAYILWDDLDPADLTVDQQQAILDWVHWGGRIIINGPLAAQKMRGSLLEELLPIEARESADLTGGQIATLMQEWTIRGDPKRPKTQDDTAESVIKALSNVDSMIGSGGKALEDASSVSNTNDLVVERMSGRGNIVLTRFDLAAGWMRKWKSAQSFFNGALLRRPSRDYAGEDGTGYKLVFAESLSNEARNPQLVTGLRILSRDSSIVSDKETLASGYQQKGPRGEWVDRRFDGHSVGGIGAWNDGSGMALKAQSILQQAAGIEIPRAAFVIRSLAWYLAILVPVNWIVFRLLGRLEWAWIIVPLIAVGGAVAIARSAQLDVGFARSRSDIAFLELQPGYPRGHLTRFVALYNSLSTSYEVEFETRDALISPMPIGNQASATAERFINYRHGFSSGVQAIGLNVASNKTELLHTEELVPLVGGISASKDQSEINNASELSIDDAFVVRRSVEDRFQTCPLGALSAGEKASLDFGDVDELQIGADVPEAIAGMMRAIASPGYLRPGESKLIGRIIGEVGSISITPRASQAKMEIVVCATLSYASLPAAAPDKLLRPGFEFGEDFGEDFSAEE